MGYYSDTILVLDKYASDELIHLVYRTESKKKLYLVEHVDEGGFVMEESGLLVPPCENGETLFVWKDRKYLGYNEYPWYNDYPQIKFIAEFLNEVGGEHYLLWSLGEDGEFVEQGRYRPEGYELQKRFTIDVVSAEL